MAGGPWDDYAPSAAKKPSAGPWEDYAPEQAPEPEKSGLLRRGIADTGVSLLRGAIAVPEAAVGIADIATGGRAGKAVQDVGVDFKRAKDIAGDFYSPEQKAANKAVADADGFFPTIAAAVQNPSVIAQSGIESVPSMLGGGVAAQGLRRMAPKVGAVGAAGIGEGLVGAGSSAEQIRQATDDGLLTDKQAALAAGSGALTSVIGAAGGAAARRLGIGDIDTIIAQGSRDIGEATNKGLLRRAGEGFVAEGALEEAPQSAQEQALQNIALDKPAGEGVGSAAGLGLLTGGAMGAAAAPFGARPAAGESAPPAVAPVEPVLDPPAPAPAAAPAPGDPLRATKLPESGPLSRGINTLIEGEAQAADAGAPVQAPVTGALAGVPAEDAAPQIPVGEATEVDPIPAGEATELPADQVQPAAGPTFDPATGEISQPQRATFPTREAVDEYLRQARLQQGGERAKAAPVELPDGTFSFLRPNEPGYEEALTESKQTVLQRKRAAAAKVKAEAAQAKPPSVLQQRRAAAAAAKEAPALPTPVAPVTKPLSVLQQRRAAALAAKQNAGAPAADTGALGSAPSVATPPTAPAPTADDTNQPRRVSTEAQAPADQAQPPARGDGAARVAEPAVAGAAAVQAAGVAPDLAGKKIDKEWTAFAPDSGTKGVPRSDMPQIKAEHRGAMTQFLGARGITHEQAEVPAADLKPTQAEFSTKKVKAARDFSETDRSILVSSDGHILDGHHQWLAARDAGKSVKVIRLDAPIDKLLAEVKEFPSASAAQGATDKTSRTLSAPARSGAGVSNSLQGFAQYGAGPAERDLAERQAEAIVGVRFPVKRSGLNARVPALFRRTDAVVLINRDMQFSQAGLVEVLAEEFMHGVDSISPSRIISGSAKRLMPAGDIRQEVEAHYSAQGEFSDFLTYPLHPIYGLEPARVRAELFARLALVYRSDARRMQAALPITYEAYHEFFSPRSDGRVREVPRPVQSAGRPGAGVRQDRGESQPAAPGAEALRPAEGRPAGGAGQREADSGLLELRRRAVDIFNGRRDGALYGGGLSSADSFDIGDQTAPPDTAAYGPAPQAQRDLVAKLQQQLQARLPGVVLDAVAPSGRDDAGATGRGGSGERSLQGKSLAAVASVAKRLFNREVVFVRFTGEARFNGLASDAYPGKVFINVDANRPLMSVLGHELVHSMRASNPTTYEALKRRLDGLLKNEQRYIDALEAKYAERGVSTKGVRHGEELHADIVGDFFMDPVFWQDMAKDKPGLFRRVANAVIKFLDDVSAQILDLRPFGTDQYLADIKAARAAVSTTLREFSDAAVGSAAASGDGIDFSLADSLTAGINNVKDVKLPAGYLVQDLLNRTGKLHWWHKTVGTMNNLAQRSPEFKRVYDATQNFINDVSAYGTAAADLAPTILPKLEGWKDIAAKPLSPADTKAISAPIFEGTLTWARDGKGRPVKLASLEDAASGMSAQDKAQAMLRDGKVGSDELKRWQNLPIDSYEGAIRNRYEREYLTAGVVWKDAELRSMFGLNDKQIGLYKEFRAATDKSLTNLAISDMLRYGGDDVAAVRQAALDAPNIDVAAELLRDHLFAQAEADPERADVLNSTGNGMIDKADKAKSLMQRGYAPLSRFGQYTVYVTEGDEQRYFGMFESAAEANRMARRMKAEFPEATVQQGTVSQEAYKMFAGVSPETLELFGGMLGLETQGNDASSQAFQTYLKLAKSNRSAMKRLIQRKGIAGFSEDAGRVLAGFVYSNARQTSSNLHMGEMTQAASDVSKGEGELKDQAVRLVDYVKNPQEEAQALRGLLFAQYLGGSVASAMVNVTQPFAVTLPYLSQYGGAIKAGGQMRRALADVFKKSTGDAALDAALKKAEDDGIVSPQEVHQLMAQAQGRGTLKSGDGTRAGDAAAKASNALSKLSLAWGKFFSTAEQFNRRITFIAAYRTAVAQGMADPAAFAADVVNQTQFTYNKGNKPAWARGAIGGTLFTFKTYSIAYVELMNRLWRSGPEGKKAALLGLAILMLLSGVDELPFVEDAEDVIDGALQRMGYNFSTKQQREQFLTNLLGEGVGRFVQKGVSGLPGVPVDLSGRLGMGNLLPGTGLFMKKTDYSRDIGEFAGPAGDFAKRLFQGAGQALGGDLGKAATTVSPVAARNVVKAFDMAGTGMYRDDRGRKVLDTTAYEAAAKAIGFQPTDVARVQDATGMQQRMIALVKIRETEIADRWAQGIFEKSPDKVAAARAELLDWNTKNPEAPIRIAPAQVKKRVQTMSQDKATRIAKTAPSEIRDSVRRELAGIDR